MSVGVHTMFTCVPQSVHTLCVCPHVCVRCTHYVYTHYVYVAHRVYPRVWVRCVCLCDVVVLYVLDVAVPDTVSGLFIRVYLL